MFTSFSFVSICILNISFRWWADWSQIWEQQNINIKNCSQPLHLAEEDVSFCGNVKLVSIVRLNESQAWIG